VFFGYDRFDLTPEARSVLERQAAWLRQYPNVRVLIAGNCDERGTREYNLALGARRAAATRDFLQSLGVAANRMETVSYGKERPLDPRSNEEAWSVNRNANTQIVSGAVS
jgi:peptidoglycan-associated lipoprotein